MFTLIFTYSFGKQNWHCGMNRTLPKCALRLVFLTSTASITSEVKNNMLQIKEFEQNQWNKNFCRMYGLAVMLSISRPIPLKILIRLYINSHLLLQLKHFLNISYSIFSFGNIKIYVRKDIHINTIVPNCDEYGNNKNCIWKTLRNKYNYAKNDICHNYQNMQNGGLTIVFLGVNWRKFAFSFNQ